MKAPQAAGKIHSDMERGFIRAEVYSGDLMTRVIEDVNSVERVLIDGTESECLPAR